jgi:hypothetical protein
MSFALLLATPAVALADITLDTSATLATDVNVPTSVEVGENSFTIKVWRAEGNVGASKTGEFKIVNEYNMAADGTITADSSKVASFDWSDLACSGQTPAVGCTSTNPATVSAKLIVAAGAQGKSGQLQISQIAAAAATSGIVTDPSPASGYVRVAGKLPGSVTISNIPSNAVFGGSFTPTYTQAGDGTPSTTSKTSGVCSVSNGVVNFDAAGTCTLQASVTEGTNHLAATGAEQSFTIARAAGSVTISNIPSSAVFGGSFTPAFTKAGDGAASASSLTPTKCTVSNAGVVDYIGAGTCTLQASVTQGTNHLAATGAQQSFTIDQASSTTTVTCGPGPFVYNGSAHTPCSVSVTGAGGLDLSPTPDYSNNVNAGTATASYRFLGDANHTGSSDSENFTIDKKQLSVNANNQSTVYGDSNLPASYELSGFENGETAASAGVTGAPVCSISSSAGTTVGTYNGVISCTVGTLEAANYSFASGTNGNLTITQRPITVKANNVTRVYGENTPAFSLGLASGSLAYSDTLADSFGTPNITAEGSAVGTHYINVSGLSNGNYNIGYATGTNRGVLTVNVRPITVTPDSGQSKVYGDSDPSSLTYQVTGTYQLLQGDSLSGALSRAAGENAGTYAITQGTLAAPNSNYSLSVVSGVNFTINKAPITLKANDASRYYNEPNPTNIGYSIVSGSFKFNDLANGDVSVVVSTNAPANALAGTTHDITVALGGVDKDNYALTAQKGTLTITAWTNKGFFAPVDYGTMQNTVKNGSTVPLKFRVFQGPTELTSTSVVSGLKPTVTNCSTGAPIDDIEELTTGQTSLRYSGTPGIDGQFIFNWQTPKKAGTCYNVTVQMVDGTSIPVAKFWLK